MRCWRIETEIDSDRSHHNFIASLGVVDDVPAWSELRKDYLQMWTNEGNFDRVHERQEQK